MWNLKYGTNEPIYRTETDSDTENRLVAKGVEGSGGRQQGLEREDGGRRAGLGAASVRRGL